MKPEIKRIIDDLYGIDPSLKARESELVILVEKLLSVRPEAEVDADFLSELRQEVMAALAVKPAKVGLKGHLANIVRNMGRPAYAFGGAALALLIVVPLLQSGVSRSDNELDLVGTYGEKSSGTAIIESLEAGAFGPLGTVGYSGQVESDTAKASPSGFGGGGVPLTSPSAVSVSSDMRIGMPAPEFYRPTRFVFDFGGTLPTLPETVSVLKFNQSITGGVSGQMLSRFGMGLVDFGLMQGTKVQNVSLIEDRDYGYQVSVNFDDGNVHIFQNWSRWPQTNCDDRGYCEEPPRITEADIPDDNTVISATDRFLDSMGVSRTGYGKPFVSGNWRKYRDMAVARGEDYWFPDVVTVIYPLSVNGIPVYDSSGPFGLNVQYSLRHGRVSGAGPILLTNFLSSDYAAQDDVTILSKAIKDGGPGYWDSNEPADEIRYGLGDPIDCYTLTYSHRTNGSSDKFLVPAWAFPVGDKIDNSADVNYDYYSDYVIVPLAKDFYPEAGLPGVLPIRIMEEPA